jgi:hypothetical protein
VALPIRSRRIRSAESMFAADTAADAFVRAVARSPRSCCFLIFWRFFSFFFAIVYTMPALTGAHARPESELERMASMSGTPIEERLDDSLRSYWLDRAAQVTEDSYAGVPLSKFPEDLRVYEHLLWADRPNTVIEIGADCGGSALWFRDRLRTLANYDLISEYHVISVDAEADRARPYLDQADPAGRSTSRW